MRMKMAVKPIAAAVDAQYVLPALLQRLSFSCVLLLFARLLSLPLLLVLLSASAVQSVWNLGRDDATVVVIEHTDNYDDGVLPQGPSTQIMVFGT